MFLDVMLTMWCDRVCSKIYKTFYHKEMEVY